MKASVSILEKQEPVKVHSFEELNSTIADADKDARLKNLPNIILVTAANGNTIAMVVGIGETVLSFQYDHSNPPYYVSRGDSDAQRPYLTAFISFKHHTEFARRNVIPYDDGLAAVREFVETGDLPIRVTWEED